MSSEWPLVKLGDLTINLDAKRKPVKEADRRPGSYPYYGASGIVDYIDGYIFEGEHLLIAEDGENLRTRQTPIAFRACGKFWVNNHAHIVIGNERASTRYLEYAILASDVSPHLTGAVMPKLTQGNLKRIEVPCPPRKVQDAIVEILGSLDDRITLLRETNATLEAIAQALFKSWFVDFDPVRAKMEGRVPEGIDEATAALFPDSLEETELGAVPMGWVTGTFGDVLTEHSKRIGSLQATVLSAVQTGELVRSDEHFNKRVHSESIEKYKSVPPLAFAYNPSRINIGSIGINESNDLGAVSPVYVVATALSKGAAYLVWHHLRSQRVRGTIATLATGTVRQSLSYSDFASISLVIPSTKVLDTFLEYRNGLYQRIWSISEQIRLLKEIRDTLLPRLISGQLRLPEVQAQLEDALT